MTSANRTNWGSCAVKQVTTISFPSRSNPNGQSNTTDVSPLQGAVNHEAHYQTIADWRWRPPLRRRSPTRDNPRRSHGIMPIQFFREIASCGVYPRVGKQKPPGRLLFSARRIQLHQTLIIPESNETNLVLLASADKSNFIGFSFTQPQPSTGQARADEIFFFCTVRAHIIGTCGADVDKIAHQ